MHMRPVAATNKARPNGEHDVRPTATLKWIHMRPTAATNKAGITRAQRRGGGVGRAPAAASGRCVWALVRG